MGIARADVPEVIHHKLATQAGPVRSKPAQVRRLDIQQEDLETHGFTNHGRKYHHISVNGHNTGTLPHGEQLQLLSLRHPRVEPASHVEHGVVVHVARTAHRQ